MHYKHTTTIRGHHEHYDKEKSECLSHVECVWRVWGWITQAAVRAGLRVNPECLPWHCLPPSPTMTVDWK